jgi:GGDEF domain-containing protein
MGRLKEAILASNVRSPGRHPLSLSAGIQRYDPDNPSSLDKLISNADGLMYEEKKAKKRL